MEERRELSRRDFLRAAMGATVVGASTVWWARSATAQPHRGHNIPKSKIGIQLYTVRDQMAQDPVATVSAIAEIGYEEVEFAGLYGIDAERWREVLKDLKLKSPSGHYGLDQFRNNPEEMLETAKTLGQKWVVLPYFRGDSLEDYREIAQLLNEVGKMARSYGLKVAYHNHAHEFEMMDGTFPMAVLLNETDPRLVDFELDLYWALEGMYSNDNPTADPVALFERWPRRFPLFHVKDGFPKDEGVDFADVGEGEIDFGRIFAHKAKSGVKHYFVENDAAPNDPNGSLDSAEDSYVNLVAEYSAGRV